MNEMETRCKKGAAALMNEQYNLSFYVFMTSMTNNRIISESPNP
jgi:hypothetical protein